jgi:hypothetical protein
LCRTNHQKTFLLTGGELPRDLLESDDTVSYKITTNFLDATKLDGADKLLKRYERAGVTTHLECTVQNGGTTERVIRRSEYLALLRFEDPHLPAVERKRYVFLGEENGFLHEIDVHSDGLIRLQINYPENTASSAVPLAANGRWFDWILAPAPPSSVCVPARLSALESEDVSDDPSFTALRGVAKRQAARAAAEQRPSS